MNMHEKSRLEEVERLILIPNRCSSRYRSSSDLAVFALLAFELKKGVPPVILVPISFLRLFFITV